MRNNPARVQVSPAKGKLEKKRPVSPHFLCGCWFSEEVGTPTLSLPQGWSPRPPALQMRLRAAHPPSRSGPTTGTAQELSSSEGRSLRWPLSCPPVWVLQGGVVQVQAHRLAHLGQGQQVPGEGLSGETPPVGAAHGPAFQASSGLLGKERVSAQFV